MAYMSEHPPTDRPGPARLFLTGTVMGAADLVPGVSGGTMALIMGIYRDFIAAIASFDAGAIRSLLTLKWRDLRSVHWWLIVPLLLGMATAIAILVRPIESMLEDPQQRIWLFSVFFGLVAASAFTISLTLAKTLRSAVFFLSGALFAFVIVQLSPAEGSGSAISLFASGAIAINAMILPGISGSFMLLLLGEYENVISGLSDLNFAVILPFALGAGLGLFSFVRLLRRVLAQWHNATMATLAGFLIGSLWKIWPWRACTQEIADTCASEILSRATTTQEAATAAGLAVVGAALVLGTDAWQRARS